MRSIPLFASAILVLSIGPAWIASAETLVENGSFENDFAGWGRVCSDICPAITTPGYDSSKAMRVADSDAGSYVYQDLPASAADAWTLEFHARYVAPGVSYGDNVISLYDTWRTDPWSVGRIGFYEDGLILHGMTTARSYAEATYTILPRAHDGEWHLYKVIAFPKNGTVIFVEDGALLAQIHGTPRTLSAVTLVAGDVAGCTCSPVPTIDYDGIKVEAVTLPDLRVYSISSTFKNLTARTVAVTVENAGGTAAGASAVEIGYVYHGSEYPIATARLGGINPGGRETVTVQWDVTGKVGNWVLFAEADVGAEVAEASESNNRRLQSTTLLAPGFAVDVFDP